MTMFRILGPVEATVDDRRLSIGGRRQLKLLAVLLLSANRAVSTDELIDTVWGSRRSGAGNRLQMAIARLRKALDPVNGSGGSRLQTVGGGYMLSLGPGELDADLFEAKLQRARESSAAGDAEGAVEVLGSALGLWRGPALAEVAFEDFAQPAIRHLEELRIEALEARIEAQLELGRHHQVVGELERLLGENPTRERLASQLMLALYRCGRHSDALECYRTARRGLVDEAGIEPSRTLQQLHQAILQQDPRLDLDLEPDTSTVASAARARLTNLPHRTRRLVGRDRDLLELCELMTVGSEPLVTMTGVGGSGKTVLAMAVGSQMLDWASGGVFLVRLAATRDPDAILSMIAEAVGITGESETSLSAAIVRRLGLEPTLLILDNFEQLAHAAPLVLDLAFQAPELRLLVTSQVPLRVSGERVFALAGLSRQDAIALFLDRARARDRHFEPADGDLVAIERVCALLDDTPLAIELAAARMTSLGITELLERLKRPLSLLTGGDRDAPARQRSLRAAIDWTHALLEPDHRALFARLGVCAGPVPVTMLEAIVPTMMTEQDLLDGLAALLDFSFVRRQIDRPLGDRFLVPQALHDYALERLIETGHEDETRRRHAEQLARIAHAARLGKWGASDSQRAELQAVSGEVRSAVAWARKHDPGLHVRLCSALAAFWVYGGVLSEVMEEFRCARDSGAGTATDRAWVLSALAKCAQLARVGHDAGAFADQALCEWEAVDNEIERALGLQYLSWVVRWEARYEEAIALADDALAVLRHTGDRRLILRSLVFLAHAHADAQHVETTEAVLREAAELADGDPVWELAAIHGDCETSRGDERAALARYVESLAWTSTTGEFHQMFMDMSCIVVPLARLGFGETALEVFELLRLERERTGRPGDLPTGMLWLEEAVATAREQVEPDAADVARRRAQEVSVIDRAAHTIDLANEVLAGARPTGQP